MTKKLAYEQLEQRINELEKQIAIDKTTEKDLRTRIKWLESNTGVNKIRVSDIGIEWDMKNGTCTFENLPVAMMWVDSTLAGLMSGAQAMVGTKRFNLALQSEGRKSVKADWEVISQFSNFEEGFKAIANIAAVAGWGDWRLLSNNKEKKQCHFMVSDSWEGRYQRALGVCWGSGMLAGKLAGYCSKLFETNCWAEQTGFIAKGDKYDEFKIGPSGLSIETEIEKLLATDEATAADMAVALQKLEIEVADRKLAEEQLRESEEKFHDLFDLSPQAVSVTELKTGKLINMNNKFCELTKHSKEQMLGKTTTELGFYSEYSRNRFKKELEASGEVHGLEMEFKLEDASTINALMFAKVIGIAGEDLVITIFYDLTERKQAEEALKKSEEKYRQLANLLPQVIFETDEKGTLTFINRNAFDAFGYTEKDFEEGLNALQMLIPKDRDFAWEKMQRTMGGEKSVGTEYTALRKDGSTFPALIYSNPVISEGMPVGLRGMIADLTEFKRTQEALKESEEKLARLKKMEALGLLAGGVAHDLNNVLAGIVSIPELLLMDLPKDSKLRKPIEIMQDSGNRAAAVVQDLLTVARGVATNKEPLNINVIVREYLKSPEFEKLKHFHPSVSVKTNLDPHLLNTNGSHVHFRKVIMNLVSNASEAIEGNGNVTISTMNRYIDKPLKGYDNVNIGEYVILSVSDDGSGLSLEDLEKIFDPFYSKKAMGRSGTGLGLAVVWNVMQDHNGYIDVMSGKNGTTFDLYFPIKRDELPDRSPSIPANDLKGNGETILIVDDVESQREISSQMLVALGYKALAVSSGEGAIEYLKKHTVDLILLDMIMDPGINGRETYKGIIKIHPGQKAVIVSGYTETDEVKKTQKLGAGQYLKKPLTLEKMGLAVKEELKKST